MRRTSSWLCLVMLLSIAALALAQQPTAVSSSANQNTVVPPLVSFTGLLTDDHNRPMTGVVGITFALYKDQQGGAPLWLETQNVYPDKTGHYTVSLGSTSSTGLPSDIFVAGEARWLGVQVAGQAEQPRVLLLSVPYALKAGDAQTVGGLPPSAFVLAAPPTSGTVTTSNPITAVQPMVPGTTPVTTAGGTINLLSKWDAAADITNSQIFDNGTNVGIATTTPAAKLDVKGTTTVRGLFTLPSTGSANATTAYNSQPIKFAASVFNSGTGTAVAQNFSLQAEPVGNNTAATSGTLNLLYSTGANKLAETGLKIASNGQITFAAGQTFPGTGSGNGSVTSVGLTAPSTDFIVTGSPVTASGTLGLAWITAPDYNNTPNAIVKRDSFGGFSAGRINAMDGFSLGYQPFAFGSGANGNAFLGFAGNSTTTGAYNTGVGENALVYLTDGIRNTALGMEALQANTSGIDNTATGTAALIANTIGNDNTASGWLALNFNTTGGFNTAMGSTALATNTTGSYDTALGAYADAGSNNLTNATAIGARAQVSQSNSLVLGSINGVNGATASTNIGIGTTAPVATLDVHGTGNFTGLISFAAGQTFPGTGTITGVNAGTGLSGGGSSGSVTLANTGVLSLSAGTGVAVSGGGQTPTIAINTTVVPQLSATNTFTGNQTVNGNLSATGLVTGSAFSIGSNLFASGSYANRTSFLGFAGNLTSTGTGNTATGYLAMLSNTTGYYNTAGGVAALYSNTTGTDNTALGANTLLQNTTGVANSACGSQALMSNVTGSSGTAMGAGALSSNTTGNGNTATGGDALFYNTTGELNTATGFAALFYNTTGKDNNASGAYAMSVNDSGNNNSASGFSALYANTSGSNNTATGYDALYYNTTASNNTATGYQALYSNGSGYGNTANGAGALFANSIGYQNVAAGMNALHSNTQGVGNVAVGYPALNANLTGSYNTGVGGGALSYNTSGMWNTAMGAAALSTNTTGSYNTAIGNAANVGAGALTNATAIGASAQVNTSNSLVLGSINGVNGASANTNVGIGTTSPAYALDVQGTGRFAQTSTNGYGVYAYDDTAGGVGVYGRGAAYSAYFPGNVYIGNLSKNSGSFKIDHPLDPANKYLYHSFVESPDMMNIYNGNVVTDKRGLATIELPDWFEALNRDFRYQLTVIGQFAQAIVVKEVSNHHFTIKTNKPSVKVSWQVTGIRQDAYANAHRIQVEVEKPPEEQGRYLHPELFGAGPEKAIGMRAPAPSNASPAQTAALEQ